MGRLDSLLKAAEGNKTVLVNNDSSQLSSAMSDSDILDFIMIELCSALDTSKLAFKGGYVLSNIITKYTPRATEVIDFSISIKEYYKDIKDVLNCIGNNLISAGAIEEFEVNEDIAELRTGGIKIYRNRGNQRIKIGVDVGLHDISYGTIPVTIKGIDVNIFSPERMLCDKISAMHTRKRFRRPKDLYDFFIITNSFNVNIITLNEYIRNRGGLEVPDTTIRDDILKGWSHAYSMLYIYNKDGYDIGNNVKPEFSDIINRLSVFISVLGTNVYWDCGMKVMINADE